MSHRGSQWMGVEQADALLRPQALGSRQEVRGALVGDGEPRLDVVAPGLHLVHVRPQLLEFLSPARYGSKRAEPKRWRWRGMRLVSPTSSKGRTTARRDEGDRRRPPALANVPPQACGRPSGCESGEEQAARTESTSPNASRNDRLPWARRSSASSLRALRALLALPVLGSPAAAAAAVLLLALAPSAPDAGGAE